MKKGSFTIGGVTSESLKMVIQSRPIVEAPLRKFEMRTPYSVDGQLPYDEGAYDNTNLELIILVDGDNLIEDRQKVYDAFDGKGGYIDFVPYYDPDKIYKIMLNEVMAFENNYMYGQKQSFTAKFTVKPYKYLTVSPSLIVDKTGATINNPTRYHSKPLIMLVGNGPAKVDVNGVEYSVSDVPNNLIIDSERYSAYSEDGLGVTSNGNKYVRFREFPTLKPGTNNIKFIGDGITAVYVHCNWRSLV